MRLTTKEVKFIVSWCSVYEASDDDEEYSKLAQSIEEKARKELSKRKKKVNKK